MTSCASTSSPPAPTRSELAWSITTSSDDPLVVEILRDGVVTHAEAERLRSSVIDCLGANGIPAQFRNGQLEYSIRDGTSSVGLDLCLSGGEEDTLAFGSGP